MRRKRKKKRALEERKQEMGVFQSMQILCKWMRIPQMCRGRQLITLRPLHTTTLILRCLKGT
ncbi:hypothetical protein E2C01_038586 [Portunus trituberculatus]|uniref:Uncharacterized protein n=1 Tax=Portunus trituberculatus TaxID=210409 RepID=A0A5B7FH78_PORTR|nr:hypothetical protein [Portunus trituberculatus]